MPTYESKLFKFYPIKEDKYNLILIIDKFTTIVHTDEISEMGVDAQSVFSQIQDNGFAEIDFYL